VIRNVIFDFGGVLVTWKPEDVVAAMFEGEALRRTVLQSVFHHPDWHELDRGTFTEAEVVGQFAVRTGLSESQIRVLLDHARDSLTLVPEMADLVHELVNRGVPVFALSNMSESTFARLRERYDIWSAFTGIVISARVGLVKPEPHIFDHLVSEFAIERGESIFIDDLEANIATADRLGFETIHFGEAGACQAELMQRLELA
jgi:putative hydrolase of the HAD superfamily